MGVPTVKGSKLLKELEEVVVRKNIGLFKCKKFSWHKINERCGLFPILTVQLKKQFQNKGLRRPIY